MVEEAPQTPDAAGTRVLVVDDDRVTRAVVARTLEQAGYETTEAAHADEARERLAEGSFAAVICDVVMPGETGFALVAFICREHPDTSVVVMTGAAEASLTQRTLQLGVAGFVPKPFEPDQVLAALRKALAPGS